MKHYLHLPCKSIRFIALFNVKQTQKYEIFCTVHHWYHLIQKAYIIHELACPFKELKGMRFSMPVFMAITYIIHL